MFGLFGKSKKKDKQVDVEESGPDVSNMSDAKQKLFKQLRDMRHDMGPEEIAKMQKAMKMQALQKKVKDDIMNDETKRERLLDDIRFHMKDK